MQKHEGTLNVLTMLAMVISVTILCSGQGVTPWPSKGEAIVNGNGTGSHMTAEFMADMTQTATNNCIFTLILRDPQSGYVWWFAEQGVQKDSYAPGFTALWQNRWRDRFWIVPTVGIVQLEDYHLQIYDMKAASLEDGQRQLLAGLIDGKENGVWPPEKHLTKMNLSEVLGEEFFRVPGSARPVDPPEVRTLGFTNGVWSITLISSILKTNAVADVELDSNMKLIKASRSDK